MKESGLGDRFFLAGYDLSGDINSLDTISGGPAVLEVTGIDKGVPERVAGLRNGQMAFTALFNPAAGATAHARLSGLTSADTICTYFHGTTLGNVAASMVAKQIGYDPTRADSGDFKFKVAMQANAYGLEWGNMYTPGIRTDTTATTGTSIDTLTSQAFGLQAYLHVFAFAGTSVTVTIEDSANNSTFAAVSGAAFTAATGITSQRIAVTGTVRQYVRVTTSGTFTNAQFAVMINKNFTAVTW